MKVQKRVPMRTCVGCRTERGKRELVRVVRTPEGEVVLDATGKRSGRGAYLCPRRECLAAARKSKSLERALEREIPAEVWEKLAQGLE
ncbi:MAG: RNase P modulator RnpM [Chitinophagales bacterium]